MGIIDAVRASFSGNKPPEEANVLKKSNTGVGYPSEDRYGTFSQKVNVKLPDPIGVPFSKELNQVVASKAGLLKVGDTLQAKDPTILLNHQVTKVFTNARGKTVAYLLTDKGKGRIINILLHTSDQTELDSKAMGEISQSTDGRVPVRSVVLNK